MSSFVISRYIHKRPITIYVVCISSFRIFPMGILGAIGLAAFLLCLSFEGDIPGTLEGLLGTLKSLNVYSNHHS